MISVWWLFVAFVGGGCAGIFLAALMRAAADLPAQSDTCGRIGSDPIRLPGRQETFCSFRCRDAFVDAHCLSQADNEERQFESQHFERNGQQSG